MQIKKTKTTFFSLVAVSSIRQRSLPSHSPSVDFYHSHFTFEKTADSLRKHIIFTFAVQKYKDFLIYANKMRFYFILLSYCPIINPACVQNCWITVSSYRIPQATSRRNNSYEGPPLCLADAPHNASEDRSIYPYYPLRQ